MRANKKNAQESLSLNSPPLPRPRCFYKSEMHPFTVALNLQSLALVKIKVLFNWL